MAASTLAEKKTLECSRTDSDVSSACWNLTDFRPPDFLLKSGASAHDAKDRQPESRRKGAASEEVSFAEFRPSEFLAKSTPVDPGDSTAHPLRQLPQPPLARSAPTDASPPADTEAEDKKPLPDFCRNKSADVPATEFQQTDFLAKSAPVEAGRDFRPLKQAPLARSAPLSGGAEEEAKKKSAVANPSNPSPQKNQSAPARPVYAWRYGRSGVWHSVRDCTIELQHGSLMIKRQGMMQQTLPCTSVTQAITYGTLGRLIVAATPGVDSLFVSLDKEVLGGLVTALAGNGITVNCVGYAEFYTLQKDLVFPANPLLDASHLAKKGKAAEPTRDLRTRSGLPSPGELVPPSVQAELGKQLDAIRNQQAELDRLEAQLKMALAKNPAAA